MHSPFLLDERDVYRVPALDEFSWLQHGFGTRLSGAWADSSRLRMLRQVHSARIICADGSEPGYLGEGDALVCSEPGVLVGVRTADCVPILIVDAARKAVAAVHAGWRGTAAGIVECTISEMAVRFGTAPRDVYAAIGPAVGECCYEVGPEVARQFARWRPELAGTNRHVKLNLAGTNRRQLEERGVPEVQIFDGAPCTVCTAELESFRRDREAAGRMVAAIGIVHGIR